MIGFNRIKLSLGSNKNRLLLWIRTYRHQHRLWKNIRAGNPAYHSYLKTQLARTLSKRKAPLPARAKDLMDKSAESMDLRNKDILCVGCRNAAEIEYFSYKGARSVTGIDLFSEDESIRVMDMHDMDFPDNSFDVVYSSHSLEHSQYPYKAVQEFLRVARPGAAFILEVPVNFIVQGADLVDFRSVSDLLELFKPYIVRVVWAEELNQAGSGAGTDAVRTLFTINKPSQEAAG